MPTDAGAHSSRTRTRRQERANHPPGTESHPRPGSGTGSSDGWLTPRRRLALAGYAFATFVWMISPLPWALKLTGWVFVSSALGFTAVGIWISRWTRSVRGEGDRRWLLEHGHLAVGTLLDVQSRHASVNHDPVVRIRVRISPTDGSAALEGTREVFVSMLSVPWIGADLPLLYDPGNPHRFSVLLRVEDDSPARVRALFRQVRHDQAALPPAPRRDRDSAGEHGSGRSGELIAALAELGRIEAARQAGTLSRRKAERQSISLKEEHFHLHTSH